MRTHGHISGYFWGICSGCCSPALWCSSDPGLISIPDPIHNPGLRERGPNEEMKHRGKVAAKRGAALQRRLSSASLFILAYCRLPPDVKGGSSDASVAANDAKMCTIPQNLVL